jgi:hypothetical protein
VPEARRRAGGRPDEETHAATIAEIRRLYYSTSKTTIQRDFERAIDLLKSLPDEDARERVAVYMDGLAQMRSQWKRSPTRGR